jgi:Lysine 2,3-aminomutase
LGIKPIERSEVDKNKIDNAIDWIAGNKNISEVLVTGGDPLTYNDKHLDKILKNLSVISHIERIRLATRVFATLPFRITDSFHRNHYKISPAGQARNLFGYAL